MSDVHILWTSEGLSCDGDTVSVTAAMQPSIEDVLLGLIPGLPKVHLHNKVLSPTLGGAEFMAPFHQAARRGMLTVGIAGYDGGKMAELDALDYLFVAPSASVHRIQEAQTTVYHLLWELTLMTLPGGQ